MDLYARVNILDGRAVRLPKGDVKDAIALDDDPVNRAKGWIAKGADRLHIVDLSPAISLRLLRIGHNDAFMDPVKHVDDLMLDHVVIKFGSVTDCPKTIEGALETHFLPQSPSRSDATLLIRTRVPTAGIRP